MFDANEREQLLVDVARMYYFENMSQQQIADRLNMSRSNISLLLKSCIANDIIEIKIHDSVSHAHEIAAQIKQSFHLKEVLISKSSQLPDDTLDNVTRLAARYLCSKLNNKMLFGYTNDMAMKMIANHMFFNGFIQADSIQLMGGTLSTYQEYDGSALAHLFQKKLNGESYILQAPLMVKSTSTRQALLSESIIKETCMKYSNLDIAAVFIEQPSFHNKRGSSFTINDVDSRQLEELGAVSRICGRYFDINGIMCSAGVNDRIVAIDMEDLKKTPLVIGIASDMKNVQSVLSCLRSGYINALIIDEALARCIVAEMKIEKNKL